MTSNAPNNQIIIYADSNGEIKLDVSLENETLWLNQKQMALLFEVKVPAINKHIKNILSDGELDASTISKMETVQKEGKRDVKRDVEFYNLDMIISLGYRVNSQRATVFRQWATKIFKRISDQRLCLNQKTSHTRVARAQSYDSTFERNDLSKRLRAYRSQRFA